MLVITKTNNWCPIFSLAVLLLKFKPITSVTMPTTELSNDRSSKPHLERLSQDATNSVVERTHTHRLLLPYYADNDNYYENNSELDLTRPTAAQLNSLLNNLDENKNNQIYQIIRVPAIYEIHLQNSETIPGKGVNGGCQSCEYRHKNFYDELGDRSNVQAKPSQNEFDSKGSYSSNKAHFNQEALYNKRYANSRTRSAFPIAKTKQFTKTFRKIVHGFPDLDLYYDVKDQIDKSNKFKYNMVHTRRRKSFRIPSRNNQRRIMTNGPSKIIFSIRKL